MAEDDIFEGINNCPNGKIDGAVLCYGILYSAAVDSSFASSFAQIVLRSIIQAPRSKILNHFWHDHGNSCSRRHCSGDLLVSQSSVDPSGMREVEDMGKIDPVSIVFPYFHPRYQVLWLHRPSTCCLSGLLVVYNC